MPLQISNLTENCFVLCTLVRFYSSVSEQVTFQIRSLTERVLAMCTFVRLHFSVGQQVLLQISSSTENFVALCTLVWLLPSVSQLMRGKFAGKQKLLDTHVARMFVGHDQNLSRLFTSMCGHWDGMALTEKILGWDKLSVLVSPPLKSLLKENSSLTKWDQHLLKVSPVENLQI